MVSMEPLETAQIHTATLNSLEQKDTLDDAQCVQWL